MRSSRPDRPALLPAFGRTAIALLLRPGGSALLRLVPLALSEFRARGTFGLLALAEFRAAGAAVRAGILTLFARFAIQQRCSGDVLGDRQLLANQPFHLAQLGR